MQTFRDLLSSTRKTIKEISTDEVKKLVDQQAPIRLIDVREGEEYAQGRLPGALSIPRGYLELRIEKKAQRDEQLILYCASGVRSVFAARSLAELGYGNVASMSGGYDR
jgi:sulfur-carrier protein adenylyltransferase/sulfurtransferase